MMILRPVVCSRMIGSITDVFRADELGAEQPADLRQRAGF
jgi:hypothetical protein